MKNSLSRIAYLPKRVFLFYVEGFRSMRLGRTLWAIILIKLFVMFAILKIFFFPSFLEGTAEEKGEAVIRELTERKEK